MENRKNRSAGQGRLTASRLTQEAKRAGLFMAGMLLGTQLNKAIGKSAQGAQGVMGLDGPSQRMLGPAVTAVAGLVLSATTPSRELQTVGYGVAATGGAMVAQELTGVQIIPQSGEFSQRRPSSVGALLDELPDPTVSGLGGEPAYIDEAGNLYDRTGKPVPNTVPGVAGGEPTYIDEEGNLYDAQHQLVNGLDDPSGIPGLGKGENVEIVPSSTSGAGIPGLGDADGVEIPGSTLPDYGVVVE